MSELLRIGLIGANEGKTWEYNLGVYNGNGLNNTANDNKDYMMIGRFVWTPFGEYKLEDKKRGGTDIVITSIPYALSKGGVVEKIAEVIVSRKLPYLLDVRDESTTDVRIVLEIKRDADPELVMAYLFKHTPLQSNFHLNLTCLVPPTFLDDEQGRKLPADAVADLAAKFPKLVEVVPSKRADPRDLVLVRPDGYVGFAGAASDRAGAEAYLRKIAA